MIVLLIAFGSLLAMALPIFIAIISIVIGLGLIALLANGLEVVSFTGLIAAMIGIGVGIDYSLFIVTRFRQGLHDGLAPGGRRRGRHHHLGPGGPVRRLDRGHRPDGHVHHGPVVHQRPGRRLGAGRSHHHGRRRSPCCPPCSASAGRNIDKFHLPALHRTASAAPTRGGFWFRWSRRIQRRPWPFALGALALLLVLAFPVTHLRLGNPDAGNDPKGIHDRARPTTCCPSGFGPGYNGPLTVAARLRSAVGPGRDAAPRRRPAGRPRGGQRRAGRDQQRRPIRPRPSSR